MARTTTEADAPSPAEGGPASLELAVTGMTCAACASRVERTLNRLDGVTASVSFATERATVAFDPAVVAPDDLVAAVEAAGYGAILPTDGPGGTRTGADADAEARAAHLADLTSRLRVGALLGLPVLVLSMVPSLQFRWWQWVALLLATPVVTWSAAPFHQAAWRAARHAGATMDTLVSLGVLAAYGWSLHALFLGDAGRPGTTMGFHFTLERTGTPDELYLEVACAVTVALLAGRVLETRAKGRAGDALAALVTLSAKEASRLDADGREERVPVEELQVGDRFVVRPGEQIATDGVVVEGRSAVDASLLTGESVPVDVGPGDAVTGSTVNTSGRLVVRAESVGADTALARIGRLVRAAQAGKAPVQRLADRVSAVFVPVVLALAAATLGFWLGAGWPAASAFTAAVAVLVIACPCALGLATPTALVVGTTRAAQLGVLIRGPEVLESTRRIDTVLLDKTGTVTTGTMAVVGTTLAEGADPAALLPLVAAVEGASEHPVARAVAAHAAAAAAAAAPPGRADVALSAFTNLEGLGVEAEAGGRHVLVGRPRLLADRGIALPGSLERAAAEAQADGHTTVAVAVDGEACAVLAVADTVRPTSGAAVAALRGLGLHPVLLTGDTAATAATVAAAVGIDEVTAEVLPADKADVVRWFQEQGRVVAMVGDGVNDAAALAQADLGIAMGSGTDLAIEAADLTLVRNDLMAAVDAIRLSRRTLTTIKANLFWAFAYNVAALPLAAAGLANPMIAGVAMGASSLFVVTNSLRLRRVAPAHAEAAVTSRLAAPSS